MEGGWGRLLSSRSLYILQYNVLLPFFYTGGGEKRVGGWEEREGECGG